MKKYLGLAIAGVIGAGIGVGATEAGKAIIAKKAPKKCECDATKKKSESKKKAPAKKKA